MHQHQHNGSYVHAVARGTAQHHTYASKANILSGVGQTKRIVSASVDANSQASSASSPLKRNAHNKGTRLRNAATMVLTSSGKSGWLTMEGNTSRSFATCRPKSFKLLTSPAFKPTLLKWLVANALYSELAASPPAATQYPSTIRITRIPMFVRKGGTLAIANRNEHLARQGNRNEHLLTEH